MQMSDIYYAQITFSATSALQYINYLPIYPSKKNQHDGIQLKLCKGLDAWTYTKKNFYLKMDGVYEIPVEYFTAACTNGRQYELQSKSWDKVQDFLRKMNARAIHDEQAAPNSVNSPIRECYSTQIFDAVIMPAIVSPLTPRRATQGIESNITLYIRHGDSPQIGGWVFSFFIFQARALLVRSCSPRLIHPLPTQVNSFARPW